MWLNGTVEVEAETFQHITPEVIRAAIKADLPEGTEFTLVGFTLAPEKYY